MNVGTWLGINKHFKPAALAALHVVLSCMYIIYCVSIHYSLVSVPCCQSHCVGLFSADVVKEVKLMIITSMILFSIILISLVLEYFCVVESEKSHCLCASEWCLGPEKLQFFNRRSTPAAPRSTRNNTLPRENCLFCIKLLSVVYQNLMFYSAETRQTVFTHINCNVVSVAFNSLKFQREIQSSAI